MWIPDPVYKKLPVIYAAAGLLLYPLFGMSMPIVVSSMMLLTAAVLTYVWRRQHEQVDLSPRDRLREQFELRRSRRLQQMHGE
jgi:hypothetical protein